MPDVQLYVYDYQCGAGPGAYQYVTQTVGSGTIINIGWLTSTNTTEFYASQCFIRPPGEANIQVVNDFPQGQGWQLFLNVMYDDDEERQEPVESKIEEGRVEQPTQE
ncbi:MAG: hypothetical protein M3320_02170 [Actinomycetota bacterium]|nr:hypothetical protein [Actinomycetota bacterium]